MVPGTALTSIFSPCWRYCCIDLRQAQCKLHWKVVAFHGGESWHSQTSAGVIVPCTVRIKAYPPMFCGFCAMASSMRCVSLSLSVSLSLCLSVSLSLSISKHLGGISMRAPTCGHLRLSLQLPELPHSVVFAELGSLCSDVGGPTTVDPWFHGGPSCNNDFSIHRIQPQIFLPPPSVLSLCTPGVLEGFALQTAPFLMAV